jgi:opacity protein-like surface antigen
MRRSCLLLTVLFVLTTTSTVAQTAQRFSIQGSILGASFQGDENFEGVDFEFGPGVEAQLRYNPSAFSIGAGFQFTTHDVTVEGAEEVDVSIDFSGLFVEPRYVIYVGSDRAAPYVAARLMRLVATLAVPEANFEEDFDAWGYNVGGGVLIRLTEKMNLDAGITAGGVTFVYDDPNIENENGTSVVLRVGVAFGI